MSSGISLAQLPNPSLDYLYPTGGQRGTTVDIEIGGRDLDEADRLLAAHPGLVGVQVMKDAASETPTAVPNRFRMVIPVNMPLGVYDLHCVGRFGVSTPRRFVVTDVPQQLEREDHQTVAKAMELPLNTIVNGRANAGSADYYRFSATAAQPIIVRCSAAPLESKLRPVLTIVDSQGRQLKRSRRVTDPLIRFQSPNDGTYFLAVTDQVYGGGNDYPYHLQLNTGPCLVTSQPHAVRPNSQVDITFFDLQCAATDGAAPDEASADSRFRLGGEQLSARRLTIFAPPRADSIQFPAVAGVTNMSDGFYFQLPGANTATSSLFINYADHPVVEEAADNNHSNGAQRINLPAEISGRFYPRRDQDWFEFQAKAGAAIQIRVASQRLGMATDPEIFVQQVGMSANGEMQVTQISTQDDKLTEQVRFRGGLRPALDLTHRDPVVRFVTDADGSYRVGLRDLNSSSVDDPRLTYRLIIEQPQPNFELLAWTQLQAVDNDKKISRSALVGRRGETLPVMIDAVRQGGFAGSIEITADRLPHGVHAGPCTIQANQSSAVLLLTIDADAPRSDMPLRVLGTAALDGDKRTLEAHGAILTSETDNVEQQRPTARQTSQLWLSVLDHELTCIEINPHNPSGAKSWETSLGAKLQIPIQVIHHSPLKGDLVLAPIGLPAGVKLDTLTLKPDATAAQIELTLADAKTPPGVYTFFLRGQATAAYARNPDIIQRAEDQLAQHRVAVQQIDAQAASVAEQLATARRREAEQTQTFATLEATYAALFESIDAASDQVRELNDQVIALQHATSQGDQPVTLPVTQSATQADSAATSAAATSADSLLTARQAIEQSRRALEAIRKSLNQHQQQADQLEQLQQQNDQAQQQAKQQEAELVKQLAQAKATDGPKDVARYVCSAPITVQIAATPISVELRAATVQAERGSATPIAVNLQRRFGFLGDVEMRLDPPQDAAWSVDPITIAGDQRHGELSLRVSDTSPTGSQSAVIRTTLTYNGVKIDDALTINVHVH